MIDSALSLPPNSRFGGAIFGDRLGYPQSQYPRYRFADLPSTWRCCLAGTKLYPVISYDRAHRNEIHALKGIYCFWVVRQRNYSLGDDAIQPVAGGHCSLYGRRFCGRCGCIDASVETGEVLEILGTSFHWTCHSGDIPNDGAP